MKVYTVLNTLFKMAYLNDVIEKNPMDKVQRPRPRKGEVQGEVEAYTVEEVRRILDGLEQEPLKWRVFLRLLIDTGIRRGECCALQWKAIDFNAGIQFYSGYLDTEQANSYLPRVLAEVLESKLDALGGRIGKLLFKLSVEEAIMAQIVAYGFNVDLDTLKKVRVTCIKDIKETNGEVDFEDAYKFQKRIE